MRKSLVVAALVAGSLSFGAFGGASADQLPGGIEGCVVTSPGTPGLPANPAGANLYSGSCSFVATRTGGFVGGAQSWKVTVTTPAGAVTTFSGTNGACNTGAYNPGDTVRVELSNGMIAAGNPIPSAVPASAAGNRCP